MSKEKIKIGILGCGRVCEHYVQKIFISERVGDLYEVVAVCDVDINKSIYVASMFSCKSYNNIQEFVQQKDIEVVIILTKRPTLRTFKNMLIELFKCNSRKTIVTKN